MTVVIQPAQHRVGFDQLGGRAPALLGGLAEVFRLKFCPRLVEESAALLGVSAVVVCHVVIREGRGISDNLWRTKLSRKYAQSLTEKPCD